MGGTKSDAGNLSVASVAGSAAIRDNPPSGPDSLLDDFWKSYVDSAVSQPYNGFSQLVNGTSHAMSGGDVLSYAPYLAAPKETRSLGGKIAEYAGQFAGAATDIAILTLAMRTGAQSFLRQGATADSVSLFGRTMRPATLATAEATIAGAAYQGIFQPSAAGSNLWTDRLKGAAIGGASFGAMAWLGQAAAPTLTRFFVPEGTAFSAPVARVAVGDVTAGGATDAVSSDVGGATAGSEPIGVAYMDGNRVLNVRMRLESEGTLGNVHLQYRPSHPQYKQVAQFLGNLGRDEGVPLTKWPFLPGGGVRS